MLYGRMLFSMVVSLYTSRVILRMLGVDDFGIQNVVGGFVSMFAIISSALSSSTSRFLTFELGRKDGNPNRIFSSAIFIHIILAAIVLVALETFGLWFINAKMVIPDGRLTAANILFQTSIISFFLSVCMVPYNAAVIAHERMSIYAAVGIYEVLFKLAIVIFVAYSNFVHDKLVVFAILQLVVGISIQAYYFAYTRKHFTECKAGPHFIKETFSEMFSFAGWNFIGCAAGILKGQGINMLLNLFYGTVINAAYGIATTVNNAVVGFAKNFMTALNPQITKSYASNEQEYLFSLINRGSRFSFYLILIFALPLMLETEFVLAKWLGDFPDYSAVFVRLFLVVSLVDIISNTLIIAQDATGEIKNYQIVVGGLLMMNFPCSWFFLKQGFNPDVVFVIAIIIGFLCLLARLLFLKKLIDLPIKRFVKEVLANIIMVSLVSTGFPLVLHLTMSEGWGRFIVVVLTCVVMTSITILFIGCTSSERNFIIKAIRSKLPFVA